jgi:transposase
MFRDEQIIDIRKRLSSEYGQRKETNVEVSDDYGVSPTTISNIKTGESYKDVGGPIQEPNHNNQKLTDEQVKRIPKIRQNGTSVEKISEMFDIHYSHAQRLSTYKGRAAKFAPGGNR